MHPLKRLSILCLALGLGISCSNDSIPIETIGPLEYLALIDVSYGGDSKQVYDIYLPKNRTLATKTLLLVHGGGWQEGDKLDMNGFKDYIREQLPDLAVVNMNYRLADENNPPHPMQINDISAVVEHLIANRDEYNIGAELGLMGVSAGGHLALLWSYAYDSNNVVKMVCSMVGPTNLADDAYLNTDNQELQDLIFQFGQDVALLKSVSPLHRVTGNSPPTLLFYGAQDPLIPISQGMDLNSRLNELNVTHEFTLYPNGGHGWVGLDLFDTSVKLKSFLETHL
tara:strand:- start:767 stop:1615 length:849 start_codon:yes stop_codon:yes gene_type:complete